jgi:hypothetical protein
LEGKKKPSIYNWRNLRCVIRGNRGNSRRIAISYGRSRRPLAFSTGNSSRSVIPMLFASYHMPSIVEMNDWLCKADHVRKLTKLLLACLLE